MKLLRLILNVTLAIGCAVGGFAVMSHLLHTRPIPPQRADLVAVPSVAVAVVEPRTIAPPIVGYGTVQPKSRLPVVPEVSGRVVRIHEGLAPGRIIYSGELLVEVDAAPYEARVRQSEAEVRSLEAGLALQSAEAARLEERIQNTARILEIDENEYETSRRLYEEDRVGTRSGVDAALLHYLRQNDAMVELTARRDMAPLLIQEAQAGLDAARARLDLARRDLTNTRIACPFDARVESVAAVVSQVVTAHIPLATLTDISALEIPIGVELRDLEWLADGVRPAALARGPAGNPPRAVVSWTNPGGSVEWTGRVARFERVDEHTRTARLVVEVTREDLSSRSGDAGSAVDLAVGMFCRVELPAQTQQAALLVPRHAVYDQRWVYVFEPDATHPATGRLARRAVTVMRTLFDELMLDPRVEASEGGVSPGEWVVVSPLERPVIGMGLALADPSAVEAQVAAAQATGLSRAEPARVAQAGAPEAHNTRQNR